MLGNLVIGLREGLEAALLVSILVTYLTKTSRAHLVRYVGYGVGAAVAFSCVVAIILQVVSDDLSESIEPVFAGVVSFIAVGFVTWMIFWMKRTARTMSGQLREKLDAASNAGAFAVAMMAFLAVAREGTETAIFFWAAAHATQHSLASVVGLVLGLAISSALGVAFYKSALKINLNRFFQVTGVLLAVVAAGVLSSGIHEFQEIGWLPGEDHIALNLQAILAPGSVIESVFSGLLNVTALTSLLQVLAWSVYVVIVLVLFLKPAKPSMKAETMATQQPEQGSVPVAR